MALTIWIPHRCIWIPEPILNHFFWPIITATLFMIVIILAVPFFTHFCCFAIFLRSVEGIINCNGLSLAITFSKPAKEFRIRNVTRVTELGNPFPTKVKNLWKGVWQNMHSVSYKIIIHSHNLLSRLFFANVLSILFCWNNEMKIECQVAKANEFNERLSHGLTNNWTIFREPRSI